PPLARATGVRGADREHADPGRADRLSLRARRGPGVRGPGRPARRAGARGVPRRPGGPGRAPERPVHRGVAPPRPPPRVPALRPALPGRVHGPPRSAPRLPDVPAAGAAGSRAPLMTRRARLSLAGAITLALAVAVLALWPSPRIDGTLAVRAARYNVRVVRDTWGVPHV